MIGTIPTEVGLLKSLSNLNLSYNYLTGYVPTELGLLPPLASLDLSHNLLSVSEGDALCALSASTTIAQTYKEWKCNNGINTTNYCKPAWTGITCDISNMVKQIDASGAMISGSLPSQLGVLKYLDSINFSNNILYGNKI